MERQLLCFSVDSSHAPDDEIVLWWMMRPPRRRHCDDEVERGVPAFSPLCLCPIWFVLELPLSLA